MLEQQEIAIEVASVIESLKEVERKKSLQFIQIGNEKIWEKKVRPDYYPGYATFVDWMERIEVHAKKDVVPYELLSKRSPNQTDKEWEYVLMTYKQSTLPVFQDFLNTIQRAWHDPNWSISYNEDEEKYSDMTFESYVTEGLKSTPLAMTLETYMRGVVPAIKLMDAMGVIAVRPWEIKTEDVNGETVISGELNEPIPMYFDSSRVVSYDENNWYLLESHEKSVVDYRNKKMKIGHVYEFYDNQNIWIIRQTGNYIDYTFTYELFYEHNLGYVPVTRLKGVPITDYGKTIWQSPFLTVVDTLDQALLDDCNLRSVKSNSVYPYRVMIGDLCDHKEEINGSYSNCVDGKIWDGEHYNICPKCKGAGTVDRVSPLGQMLIKPGNSLEEGDNVKPGEAMAYHGPSTETPAFLRKEFEQFMAHARQLLHLKTTDKKVQGAEDMTATGMVMDERAKFAFIKTPSDQIFDLYFFLLETIGRMRYAMDYAGVELQKPNTFDFKTEEDYLTEISRASKAGVPPFVIFTIIERFLRSLYFTNEEVSTVFETIIAADRLMSLNENSIAMKAARKQIADWEVILHDSAIVLIRELLAEDPKFGEKELEERVALLEQKAKDRATAIAPTTTDDIMMQLDGSTNEPPSNT